MSPSFTVQCISTLREELYTLILLSESISFVMVRVYAHVVSFGSMLALSCAVAYGIAYVYGKSDETKKAELDARFKDQKRVINSNRPAMDKFFKQMEEKVKHPEIEDEKMNGMKFASVVPIWHQIFIYSSSLCVMSNV